MHFTRYNLASIYDCNLILLPLSSPCPPLSHCIKTTISEFLRLMTQLVVVGHIHGCYNRKLKLTINYFIKLYSVYLKVNLNTKVDVLPHFPWAEGPPSRLHTLHTYHHCPPIVSRKMWTVIKQPLSSLIHFVLLQLCNTKVRIRTPIKCDQKVQSNHQ